MAIFVCPNPDPGGVVVVATPCCNEVVSIKCLERSLDIVADRFMVQLMFHDETYQSCDT